MSIVYAQFEVSLHRLNLTSKAELEALRQRIAEAVAQLHPEGHLNIMAGDIEVVLAEHAGTVPE